MKTSIRSINDYGTHYDALAFVCPGCATMPNSGAGLHMLPVNTTVKSPSWDWDGNRDAPTLSPSILTRTGSNLENVCHSFIRSGVIEFLGDCTHRLAGQHVALPDLPDWMVR